MAKLDEKLRSLPAQRVVSGGPMRSGWPGWERRSPLLT